MLTLSQPFIEELTVKLLTDYYGTEQFPLHGVDIDGFATEYMKMKIRYEKMTYGTREILGATAYEKTVLQLDDNNPDSLIQIDSNTILLNSNLQEPEKKGRRNFTLAHECGHQAIYLLEPIARPYSCRTAGKKYFLRDLKTENDWSEWQANTFSAAFMMPRYLIDYYFYITQHAPKVVIYPFGNLLHSESRFIRQMANFLGVSKTAMLIRLKQLQLTELHSDDEYHDMYMIDHLKGVISNGAVSH